MNKAIIIDDSETMRDDLKSELEKNTRFEVLTAEDGLLGLEVIRSNQDCTIIITDLNMPNMDGFEMLETLHKENLCPNTPKIILTTESILSSENSKKLVARGKELGVEAWLPKGGDNAFILIHEIIGRILKKRN